MITEELHTGDDEESAQPAPTEVVVSGRWTDVRTVWIHALLLAAVLVAVLSFVDNGANAIADEAVYTTQAQALVDGSWTSPRPAPDLDPDGAMAPLLDSTIVGDRVIAYSRHPLYPVVLVPAVALGGYSAALYMSCAGTVAAALCAAFLARRLDRRYGVPALWIAGVASPLIFDAVTLWGHSLVAATAGLATLAVLRITDGGPVWRHVAYGLPAVVATVMLRSEGVVFALALGVVIGLSSLRRTVRSVDRRALATGASVGLVGVVAYWLDGLWAEAIGGSGYGTKVSNLVLDERTGPAKAAWRTLLLPARSPGVALDRWLVAATVSLVLAALAARLLPRLRSIPWVLAVVAAVGWTVSLATTAGDWNAIVAGLFVAWPLLLVAVLLTTWSDLRNPDVARCLAVGGVGAVFLVISIYEAGGAIEWGGRFFHILLVPLVGPAVLVLHRASRRFDRAELRAFAVPVVVLLLVPSAFALTWVAQRKVEIAEQVRQVAAIGERVTSGDERPLAVVWRVRPDGTSRSFWSLADRMDVLDTGNLAELYGLLDEPSVRRRKAILVITDLPLDFFTAVSKDVPHSDDWNVDRSETWNDERINVIVLRSPTA